MKSKHAKNLGTLRRLLLNKPSLIIITSFAILGITLAITSHAATNVTSQEAEAGVISGNASTLDSTSGNASGGKSVAFGQSGAGGSASHTSGLPWESTVWVGAVSAASYTSTVRGGVALDGVMNYTDRSSQSAQINSVSSLGDDLPAGFNQAKDDVIASVTTWTADGSFMTNAQGKQVGTALCKIDSTPIVRLNWEMNLPGGPGDNGEALTSSNFDAWVARFRAVSLGMKSGCPGLRVDFNPNHDPDQTSGCSSSSAQNWCTRRAATQLKDVIDFFSIDIYDNYQSLDSIVNSTGELNESYKFAQSIGKKFGVPEWGLDHASNGRGDDPAYINLMMDWFNAHASGMSYETYFDETASYIVSDLVKQNPQSRQAMINKLRQYKQ